MKKQLLFTMVLLISSILSFGQSFKLDATGTNDIRLRTFNIDRLTIFPNGYVGIGTNNPKTVLHVLLGSAGVVTAFPTTVATIESYTSAYLSILSPATLQGGVIFGSPVNNNNGYVSFWHPLT